MTTVALVDVSRPTVSGGVRVSATRALSTVVWSPAVAGAHRWPLVLFAPGYRVGPGTYARLCQYWAARGYVVAAPSFPLADPAVAGASADEGDLANEPADVRFVIASLLDPAGPAPAVMAAIDPGKVGVAGHSDGAEVALALVQQGNLTIKAVIAMAGQPVAPQPIPNPPLLVMQGDHDTINPPRRSQAVFDQAAPPRFLLTLVGGSHLGPFSGTSQWEPVVEAVSVDFLNHYLAGTTTDDTRLVADATHPGISSLR
jgi:dienelactone hydrolase